MGMGLRRLSKAGRGGSVDGGVLQRRTTEAAPSHLLNVCNCQQSTPAGAPWAGGEVRMSYVS